MTTTEPETEQGLRLVKLQAENIKRLKAVEITPDGDVVTIAGRNAQGKSSVLDSIEYAIGGKPKVARPVRDGETEARIVADLGDLVVTREWKNGKPSLSVRSADGARYDKPQAILDGLVGRLSFDPLGFTNLSDKEQLATLLGLVDLPFDPAQLDAERQSTYDERREINRDAKRLADQLDVLDKPAKDLPEQEVAPELLSTASALDAYREAQEAHSLHEDAAIRNRLAWERVEAARRELAEAEAVLNDTPDPRDEPLPDLDALRAQVDEVESTNRQRQAEADEVNRAIRAAAEYRKQKHVLEETKAAADDLTRRLDAIDRRKADALAAAKMPVDGLGFETDGVTYNGVPFRQCSSAEQLRVSLAMGMALNPRLRVLLIRDGSLMDSESLRLVSEMAAEHGYQIWIERVEESGKVGVVIEDGEVAQ